MKKTMICFLIVASVLLASAVTVFAEPTEGQKPILDVIRDQGDYLPTDNVYNKEKYDETMEGYDFTDDFLLKVYPSFSHSSVKKDMHDIILAAKSKLGTLHVALRDKIVSFQEWRDGTITRVHVIGAPYYYDYSVEVPTFINDIKNSDIYQSELHTENNEYTRIVCFDTTNQYGGMFIYYIGSERTIVRVYKDRSSQAVDLLEEDFQAYCLAYCAYIEANPGIRGGNVHYFIENYTVDEAQEIYDQAMEKLEKENQTENENLTTGTEGNQTNENQSETESDTLTTGTEGNQPNEKDSGASALWWIIPTAAAVVLLGGAIAFIALRKKKTKS